MNILEIPCNPANYGGYRGKNVKYLVIHYTAAPGDTAKNNGEYFAREKTGTSAHYFVDENTVVRSVAEEYAAWHCGAAVYRHPDCRNQNSIGIEICTKGGPGDYRFAPEAVELAKQLTKQLMERYNIGPDDVLRHYDVTGKVCPAPFVGQGDGAWETFKGGLMVYKTVNDVPQWGQKTIQKLLSRGILEGDGENLNLSYDLVRTLVILDRAEVWKENNNGNTIEQIGSDLSE